VQRSQATWQVSWIEATHGADARSAQSFTGLFTVRFDRPRNADELMHNPLGLFITEFSMSPETPASSYSRGEP
jgi:type IV secretory pathway TrbF-like protein